MGMQVLSRGIWVFSMGIWLLFGVSGSFPGVTGSFLEPFLGFCGKATTESKSGLGAVQGWIFRAKLTLISSRTGGTKRLAVQQQQFH